MTNGQAREEARSQDHRNPRVSYTRFPKDWTAEQIYEYLMARAEGGKKARDDVSRKTTKKNKT